MDSNTTGSQNFLYLHDKKDIFYIIDNFDYIIMNNDDDHIFAIDIMYDINGHIIGYIATNLLYNVIFKNDTLTGLTDILEKQYNCKILDMIKKDI